MSDFSGDALSGAKTGVGVPVDSVPTFSFWKSSVDLSMKEQVDQLLREERVLENARNDGRRNLPVAEADQPTLTEQRLAERPAWNLKSIGEALKKAIRELGVVLSGLSVMPIRLRLQEIPAQALFEIKKFLGDRRDELVQARTEADVRQRDMNHFQSENLINRAPYYPSAAVAPWLWFLLGLVGLVEAGLNAHFWAPTNPDGMIGGFFKAGFIAVLNLAPAVLTGLYIVPKLAHVDASKRAYAWPLLILWMGSTCLYNLFIGHWRVTADTGAESLQAAATSLLSSPVAGLLLSGDAMMLAVAGVVAAIIAVIDAATMDDRYWGYGEVARRNDAAQRIYTAQKLALRQQLGAIVARFGDEVSAIVAGVPGQIREVNRLMNEAASIREECHNSVGVQQAVLESALKCYRDENRRVRTSIVPTYFSSYPVLPQPDLDPLFGAMLGERNRFLREVGQVAPVAERVKAELLAIAEEQFEDLLRYVEGVETEASRRFHDRHPTHAAIPE